MSVDEAPLEVTANGICVVGLGKLGTCLAALLANSGWMVRGVDTDIDAALRVRQNEPSPEPGLNEQLARALTVSPDYDRVNLRVVPPDVGPGDALGFAVAWSDTTFIVVPTPSLPNGHFDSTAVEKVVRAVKERAIRPHTAVVCSTVSPGTMGRLAEELEDDNFQVVYSPFFIALGSIIKDMAEPDFRLIGSNDYAVGRYVGEVLSTLDGDHDRRVRYMGLGEAEVTKLAVNAYLVMKAAYANTIAMACMNTGVDSRVVMQTVGLDHRIGPAMLTPGAPPGGPCLPRDSKALQAWLQAADTLSILPSAVSQMMRLQIIKVLDWLEPYKKVGILGLAYKPGTPVTDGSLGWTMMELCHSRGQIVLANDPEFDGPTASVELVVDQADAILVTTDHAAYRGLDTKGKPTLDMWAVVALGDNVTVWGQ